MRRSLLVSGLAVLAFTLTVPARAGDDEAKQKKEEALQLVDQLDALRKDKKTSEITEAIAKVPPMYKDEGLEDKGARGKLMGALGDIVKDDRLGAARNAAVEALVAMDDPKAAWKEIHRELPDRDVEEATEFQLLVVKATGELAPSRAVKDLLELVEKAKDGQISKEAALALGGYSLDTRNRVKILDELVSLGRRFRPGYSADKGVSQSAQERWALVGPGIVGGLNRLTNRQIKTFEEWELLYDDNKKHLKDLFRDEDQG